MPEQPKGSSAANDTLRIAQINPDIDTRRLFAHLMKDAEAGKAIGALVIVFEPPTPERPGGYTLHLAGSAATRLTYTAGALSVCEYAMRRKIAAEMPFPESP